MNWKPRIKCWLFSMREALRPRRRERTPEEPRVRLWFQKLEPRIVPFLERLEERAMPSIVTPFTPRFSTNATGDIAIIGNTLETASTVNNAGRTAADVTAAQNGVTGPNGNHVDNNDWNMAYVNVDNSPGNFNSSQATLTLPAGATVLFAGLYWGSVTTTAAQAAARDNVKFSTPASGGLVALTGIDLGGQVIGGADFTGLPVGNIYQAFANVTSLVQAAGSGTYEVANVQAAVRDANGNLPYMGSYAGWSLVVAYSVPGAPERNLTVFDGYAVQQSNDPPLNIPISGFIAPPSGTVNAKVGVVVYEGDLGITGDSMALNSKQLSDAVNPANNFFDSVISNLGAYQTAKNPNYVNQMGFDAKIVQVPSGTILNGATSATITLSTSGDGYFPGVVTTAIDLYAPNLVDTKSVTDVTSGGSPRAVAPGDVLQYTVNLTNSGLDSAGNVVLTDPIPANTQYVPGSLQIVSGANAGSKTDAAGDDQAEFNAAGNDVVFRLGTGANAASGGTLAINASTTISFEVQVNAGTPANTIVANRATTAFKGVTTGTPFTSTSNIVALTVLGLSTTPNPATVTLGPNPVTLTDTATLAGGSSPTGTITFTLFQGGTLLGTEKVTVSGNGTYTTPTGFTLPGNGTVTGTYQWDATYSGDSNNSSVSDNNAANEQVTVSSASPTITTAPNPPSVTLGLGRETLTDAATLAGGFRPTGTITFTLFYNGGTTAVDTETVTVSGNGTYTTPTGYQLPRVGAVTGTYQWDATYSGDPNNNGASDLNALNELVTVSAARPSLTTTPSSTTVTLGPGPSPILTDTADLQGAFFPNGTITFTLFYSGSPTPVDTETVPVNDNGTFTTPTGFTLPTTGAVAGTYQWIASFEDKFLSNNVAITDANDPNERVTVIAASPTIVTMADPTGTIMLGTTSPTLNDTALLAGGYNPTGTLLFTLKQGGATVFTRSDTVTGNGTYTTAGFTLPTTGTVAGTYTWTVAYSGDGNNNAANDQGGPAEQVTVSPASPQLSTQASAGGPEGSTAVFDTATLSGGFNESGLITFNLEDANNKVVFTSIKPANGNSAVPSDSFTPLEDGTYHWVVSFAGDANNTPISDFTSSSELVIITEVTPTLTTSATPSTATVGQTVTVGDTAILTGQAAGNVGTVTFMLTAPDGSTLYTSTAFPESGNFIQSTSTTQTLSQVGMYTWHASYDDEGNITSDTGVNETVTVGKASPTISTQASAGGPEASTAVFDTATLSGGFNESGLITFNLEDANNNVVFTDTKSANGNSAVASDSYTPAEDGSYHWVVSYAGDSNNNPISDFTSPQEQVVITEVTPTLTTSATPSTATVGQTVTLGDTATLTGQDANDAGTVTFTLTAPDGSAVYTSAAFPETGDFVQSTSTTQTLSQVGTYTWHASYDDEGNITSDTGVNETVTVGKASPTISTQASAGGPEASTAVFDTATLSGGFNESGNIVFELEDANNKVVFTSIKPANGNSAVPSDSFTPLEDGTYHWVVSFAGDANNTPISDFTSSSELVIITEVTPTLTTSATPSTATVGQTVTVGDTAILTGQAAGDVGRVTFLLTAPDGSTLYTSTAFPESGNFIQSTSTTQTLSQVGTYTWHASYDDEGNITSDTGVNETVTVGKASPTISTLASAGGPEASTAVFDTATLSGGFNESGNIVFELEDANNNVVFTSTKSANGSSAVTSDSYTPAEDGNYHWVVSYAGDSNNNPISDNGSSSNEQVVITEVTPTLTTSASPSSANAGDTVTLSDTATLTGQASGDAGTVTFTLTAPDGSAVYTSAALPETGDFVQSTSTTQTLSQVGMYTWHASYDDEDNITSDTGVNETVTVGKASPQLSTQASAGGPEGSTAVFDTATLSGGFNESGLITFNLEDANNDVVFTSIKPANGNNPVPSDPYTPAEDGTYHWVVSFAGDANNNPISDFTSPQEQVDITEVSPALTTSATPTTATVGTTVILIDTATLTGQASGDTGTVTFMLTAPDGSTLYTSTAFPESGNFIQSTSTTQTLSQVGTYTWHASYDDEGNITSDTGVNETVTVGKASPTISTQASAGGPEASTAVFDTATLSGGFNESGLITFNLEDANNNVVFTDTKSANGNSAVASDSYTPAEDGSYHWVVSYAGDSNNNPISDNGSSSNEQVVITEVTPTLTTSASPSSANVGDTVTLSDTATLTGQASGDAGTVTFTLKAPDGTILYTSPAYSETGNFSQSTATPPLLVSQVGMYTWHAVYNDEGNLTNDTGVNETVTVGQTTLQLSTQASPGGPEGSTAVFDTATLSGGFNETGLITFNLENAGNNVVFTDTKSANGNNPVPSDSYTPAEDGTYHWVVSFAGDANNNPISDFTSPQEQVVITEVTPTLTTSATPSTATVGQTVTLGDTATLTGQDANDAGTVTFTLTAPDGSAVYTSAALPETGDFVQSTSTTQTLSQVGTYTWHASYDDEGNITSDNGTNETVTIGKASPTISTQASAGGPEGSTAVFDTATLSGGFNESGLITFNLEDANNNVVFTDTKSANGNSAVASESYTPAEDGSYHWVVSYAGDSNNNPISDNGSSSNEQMVITEVTPTLTTLAAPNMATVGETVTLSDTAFVTGQAPGDVGTVTFTLTAPDGTIVYTSAGYSNTRDFSESTSTTQTLSQVGAYTWHASYDDEGNLTSDNGTNETVTVGKASPTISTQASAGGPEASTAVFDTATLSGGFNESGLITFNLEDANNNVVFTDTKSANGNSAVASDSYTPAEDGNYHWVVSYAGDSNNNPISDNGSSSNEQVVITEVTPTLTTSASPSSANAGDTVTLSDTATLTGQASGDAGTVTFTLTAPDGSAVYTSAALPETGDFVQSTSTTQTLSQVGMYTWHASYDDEGNITSDNGTNETVTVGKASPTISTQASAGGPEASTAVFDTATLSGGFNESGLITFNLEDANNNVVFTNIKPANGNNPVPSDPYTPAEDGTYHWVVSFAGDANNNPISDFTSPQEQVDITEVSPALTTSATPTTATVGTTVILIDTATLTGQASGDTGTVTFMLTAPDGSTLYTSTAFPESGNFIQSTSTTQTLSQVGAYTWHASYDDEGNLTSDNGTNETVTVGKASPTISTQASAGGPEASTAVFDTATLSGGFNESGLITFNLEDANNNVVFTDTKSANGNSAVASDSYTPAEDGSYHWVVSYAGDSNNNPISDNGSSSNEQVVITEVTPTLTTSASPSSANVGDTVTLSDTATLTGQASGDAGTVTFTLTAPDGSAVYTSAALPETGNFVQSTSTTQTLSQVGMYTWHASYDDEGNITTDTGVNETVTVGKASPTISTQTSAGGPEGSTAVFDTATLSGGFNESGLITFNLEDANNNVVFTSTKSANGNSAVASESYTPAEDGSYHWVVSYAGDSNNNPISDNGSSSSEQVVITEVTPTLTTLAAPNMATVGETVTLSDTAFVTGQAPGDVGTVTFTLTAPDGTIVYTSAGYSNTRDFSESTSTTQTLTQVGTYTWHASYDDEGNITSDTGVNETVTVGKASPTISTTPNPTTGMLGGTLQDLAELSGGFDPTGSITFSLYAPGVDPTVGPAAYTEVVTGVDGNGAYQTTVGFTSNATGIWHWVANYNGDSNNDSVVSGPLEEPVTVAEQADLVLAKTVSNATPNVGDTVTFTVTLTNKGPDTATNVSVSDALPAGLTLVSATPSQGSYAGGVWTVGTVAVSAAPTLTLTARVVSPNAETNTASISHADQFDPNTGNNSADATVTPLPRPLSDLISKVELLGSTPPGAIVSQSYFVDQLYVDILDRLPDLTGLNHWVFLLEAGISRAAVVNAIWSSAEHRGIEVDQFYSQYLHRAADPIGRAAWIDAFLAGATETDIAQAFVTSKEYIAAHQGDIEFVQGLYEDVLGRAADATGLAVWLQALQGGASRATLASAILTSTEADLGAIDQYYTSFLQRPADQAGELAWLGLVQDGPANLGLVGELILASGEFYQKAQG